LAETPASAHQSRYSAKIPEYLIPAAGSEKERSRITGISGARP